jgi:predicted dehydrogenase
MTLEMKRIAPGETNTWYIEVLGTTGGVKYSTKNTKTLWTFKIDKGEQYWQRTDLGFKGVPFPTVTGSIFEPGFSDGFMQMLTAYIAEREGILNDRFGCVTPDEAVASHRLFSAALQSHKNQTVEHIIYD